MEELKKLFGGEKDPNKRTIADYIIWQLSTMENRELAETTKKELLNGTLKLNDVWNGVYEYAKKRAKNNCAMVSSVDVFRVVREHLHIDGVVSDEQAAAFNPLAGKISEAAIPESTVKGVNLDLDLLFG